LLNLWIGLKRSAAMWTSGSRHARPQDRASHVTLSVQVSLLMRSKIRRLSESLIATVVGTEIGLLTSVGAQVSPKIEVKREFLSTELTFKRFFSLYLQLNIHEFALPCALINGA
jgi:hypothetical protein